MAGDIQLRILALWVLTTLSMGCNVASAPHLQADDSVTVYLSGYHAGSYQSPVRVRIPARNSCADWVFC